MHPMMPSLLHFSVDNKSMSRVNPQGLSALLTTQSFITLAWKEQVDLSHLGHALSGTPSYPESCRGHDYSPK